MNSYELVEHEGVFVCNGGNGGSSFDLPSNPEIELMIKSARSGWREAMTGHRLEKYVTDEKRVESLLKILPLQSSYTVLEIGPGFGQMTTGLAKRVTHVDAVEVDLQQARFCAIKAAQDHCTNVRIIAGGADAKLPVPTSSYNFVLMNLVLEWCGLRSFLSHEEVQRRYLSEINRVLIPGGAAFISTKNRYSLRLLAGGRDEHMSSLRFGSALPRWLGSAFMRNNRPSGLLHSRRHLKRMLMEAGLTDIKELVAVPDMRWTEAYVPAEEFGSTHAKGVLTSLPRRARVVARLLPISVVKLCSPGLSFLARKPID